MPAINLKAAPVPLIIPLNSSVTAALVIFNIFPSATTLPVVSPTKPIMELFPVAPATLKVPSTSTSDD